MKLGTFVQITRGVKDLETAIPFYEALGFTLIGKNEQPYPWAQLSDGRVTFVLGVDGNEYTGLTYFAPDMKDRAEALESEGITLHNAPYQIGDIYQKMISDPEGFWISLIEYDAVNLHAGEATSRMGTFGEFTLPTKDLETRLAFYKTLGFDNRGSVFSDPYPWSIMMDGMMILGLHQTDQMGGPAVTYFAPNQAERIAALKEDGVALKFEMKNNEGIVNNAIAVSPDGMQFNFFEGDIDAFVS